MSENIIEEVKNDVPKEEIKEEPKKEKKPLIINGIKIEFKEKYTGRQWLSQQNSKMRELIESQIPAMCDALKTSMKKEEIKDLDIKDFMALYNAYSERVGMSEKEINFLG